MDDLVARRDDCKLEDQLMKRADIDNSILELAKDAERKLKRLKMAKFSFDLFDEIISEMMRDKKTIMEMLAELDCDEE